MNGPPARPLTAIEFSVLIALITKRYGPLIDVKDALEGTLLHAASLASVAGIGDGRLAKMAKLATVKRKISGAMIADARRRIVRLPGSDIGEAAAA